jgi:hypothetical protein
MMHYFHPAIADIALLETRKFGTEKTARFGRDKK